MPAQNVLQHQEFLYDFAVNGGAVSSISLGTLPKGAIVSTAHVSVEATVTSAGSSTVAFGNKTTTDEYIGATAFASINTAGKVIGGDTNKKMQNVATDDGNVMITIGTDAITAGKLRLSVDFFIPSTSPLTVG